LFLLSRNTPLLTGLQIKDALILAGVGMIGIASYSVLLSHGQKTVPSGLASFIVAQTPVITATLAIFMLKEKPSLYTFFGILISMIGIYIIWQGQSAPLDVTSGLLLLIMAAFCGSVHSILQKHILTGLSPYQVTALSTWFATLGLLIFLPELTANMKHASLKATVAIIFLGVVPSTLGQLLWCYGLRQVAVTRATTYLYVMPLLSTLFAWIALDEIPGRTSLLGGSIALLGAIIVKKV
jgi:drug/metabolite transporter (DMT)-like permease